MKNLIKLLSVCVTVMMQSCSSDQEPAIIGGADENPATSKMIVKYNNHIYETDVITVGDSTIYLNEEYSKVYRSKIETNPNIAVVMENGTDGICRVEYFDSEKQLLNNIKIFALDRDSSLNAGQVSNTRADIINLMPPNNPYPVLGMGEMFVDKDFGKSVLVTYATTNWGTSINNLKELGFNDRTSSIRVTNCMYPEVSYTICCTYDASGNYDISFKTYKGSGLRPVLKCNVDKNHSGAVLYCIATPTGSSTQHQDYNLKGIKWNDKISSLEWVLVYDFSNFYGTNPLIPSHNDC